jgi:hypothetical protein
MNRSRWLKGILVPDVHIDDLLLAQADLRSLDAGYQQNGVETPEWIIDKLDAVAVEINSRNRAEIQRRLKAAKSRRAAIATVSEQRKKLEDQIKDLESRLA